MRLWQLIKYLLSPHGKEETMVKVGESAPEFDALDHTGKKRRLSEFKGKTVILWFYPAADTPG